MADNTVVIISSDHGGKTEGHGGPTLEKVLSPLILVGPGVEGQHRHYRNGDQPRHRSDHGRQAGP